MTEYHELCEKLIDLNVQKGYEPREQRWKEADTIIREWLEGINELENKDPD